MQERFVLNRIEPEISGPWHLKFPLTADKESFSSSKESTKDILQIEIWDGQLDVKGSNLAERRRTDLVWL
jgi:hypothetical protein